jgi:hypothetical protein
MYYEERKINGVWMWRGTPNGPWHTFTDGVRRQKMREDLLEMAERALDWDQWDCEAMQFEIDCRAFAADLSQRITVSNG